MATVVAPRATRGLAQLERADEVVKPLAEEFVNLGHHPRELRAIKMALHHVDHIVDQQISLGLHDGRRVGADKQHHKIVTRLGTTGLILVVEFGIVKSDFNTVESK